MFLPYFVIKKIFFIYELYFCFFIAKYPIGVFCNEHKVVHILFYNVFRIRLRLSHFVLTSVRATI